MHPGRLGTLRNSGSWARERMLSEALVDSDQIVSTGQTGACTDPDASASTATGTRSPHRTRHTWNGGPCQLTAAKRASRALVHTGAEREHQSLARY